MDIDKNVSCISDYLSIISELNKSYTIQGMWNSPCTCKFLYRGISNEKYELIPSILRKTYDIDITNNKPIMHSNKIREGVRSFSTKQSEVIFSFRILAHDKQFILRELDNCGINEKTLFPGLDGIGRYIEMKYRFDLEEAKNIF